MSEASGSSLRGWTASATSPARYAQVSREDVDRSGGGSSSSLASSHALRGPLQYRGLAVGGCGGVTAHERRVAPSGRGLAFEGPVPSSSPVLGQALSGRSPGGGPVGSAGPAMEEQIKSERRWWQEHLLQEVARIEATVSKEISKSTSALREHLQLQMEVERADGIQREKALERLVGRIRDEMDRLQESYQQLSASKAVGEDGGWSLAIAEATRRASADLSQSEAALRLELKGAQARLEDDQRAHREELGVHLAQAQASLEGVGQQLHLGQDRLREDLRAFTERLASAEHSQRAAEGRLEQAHAGAVARLERLEARHAADVDPSSQSFAAAAAAGLEAVREELLQALASEHRGRLAALEELKASMARAAEETARRASPGEMALEELAGFLDAECTARKSDVEELRRLLHEVSAGRLQQCVDDLSARVDGLVSTAEAEREARRTDSERHQMSVTDLMDALRAERLLRTSEATRLRQALADLALNMNAALGEELALRGSEGLTQALQALQAALAEETLPSAGRPGSGSPNGSQLASSAAASVDMERRKLEVGALRSDRSAALGKEATELVAKMGARIRALGDELRTEMGQRVEAASSTLRGEVAVRLEVVGAEIRAECSAKHTELKGDIVASCQDLHAQLTAEWSAELARASEGGAAGRDAGSKCLQSSAASMGQLSEVLRLMQIMEALAEKICSEATTRKAVEARLEQRVASVEQQLFPNGTEATGGLEQMPAGVPEQEELHRNQSRASLTPVTVQTLMSDDLKDSLEKLVDRVNTMLKGDDVADSMAASRQPSPQPAPQQGAQLSTRATGIASASDAQQPSRSSQASAAQRPAPPERRPASPRGRASPERPWQGSGPPLVVTSPTLRAAPLEDGRLQRASAASAEHQAAARGSRPPPAVGVAAGVAGGGATAVQGDGASSLAHAALLQKAIQEMPQLQQENQALRGQLQAPPGRPRGSAGATPTSGLEVGAPAAPVGPVGHWSGAGGGSAAAPPPGAGGGVARGVSPHSSGPQLPQWGLPQQQAVQHASLLMHASMGSPGGVGPGPPHVQYSGLRPQAMPPGGAYGRPMQPYLASSGYSSRGCGTPS